jgi:hypothetical protein
MTIAVNGTGRRISAREALIDHAVEVGYLDLSVVASAGREPAWRAYGHRCHEFGLLEVTVGVRRNLGYVEWSGWAGWDYRFDRERYAAYHARPGFHPRYLPLQHLDTDPLFEALRTIVRRSKSRSASLTAGSISGLLSRVNREDLYEALGLVLAYWRPHCPPPEPVQAFEDRIRAYSARSER